ncbi:YceI family protein [bacterium]|nr:YceI family protein [bacterium]
MLWNIVWSVLLLAAPVLAEGLTRFEIKDLTQRNILTLHLEAPLEKVAAQCPMFRGYLSLHLEALEKGIEGELEFDLRSLNSGSGLRDIFINEKVFDHKQFPLAKLRINRWSQAIQGPIKNETPVGGHVEGVLSYREKTVPVKVPLQLVYFPASEKTKARLPGNLLRLSSRGQWDFKNLGISVPQELSSVFGTQAEIVFDAVGSDQTPNDKILLPEGPKPKERS